MANAIEIQGLEGRQAELRNLMTTNPAMRRHIQAVIRKKVGEARKRIVEDAKDVLENDPRKAYLAVRSSVYRQVLGAQVNILSSRKRGAPTRYRKPRKLDENPHKRGGNRRKRSQRTMQVESYQGVDRGFILRFQNAGTQERQTRYGNRGSISARPWFGISSAFQVDRVANEIAELIERALDAEFKLQ